MASTWVRRLAMVAAVIACVAGAALLVWQAPMAAWRDEAALEKSIGALYPKTLDGPSFSAASQSYFRLIHEQDTGKTYLFDLGTALLALGLLVLAGVLLQPVRAFIARTCVFWKVALLSAVTAAAFAGGAALQALVIFDRRGAPPWADSVAIPLAGATMIAPVFFILLIGLAGLPHLLQRGVGVAGTSLLSPPRGAIGVFATVVYGLLAIAWLWLAATSVFQPAGWLLAPASMLAAWLMLHARAVAVG